MGSSPGRNAKNKFKTRSPQTSLPLAPLTLPTIAGLIFRCPESQLQFVFQTVLRSLVLQTMGLPEDNNVAAGC